MSISNQSDADSQVTVIQNVEDDSLIKVENGAL